MPGSWEPIYGAHGATPQSLSFHASLRASVLEKVFAKLMKMPMKLLTRPLRPKLGVWGLLTIRGPCRGRAKFMSEHDRAMFAPSLSHGGLCCGHVWDMVVIVRFCLGHAGAMLRLCLGMPVVQPCWNYVVHVGCFGPRWLCWSQHGVSYFGAMLDQRARRFVIQVILWRNTRHSRRSRSLSYEPKFTGCNILGSQFTVCMGPLHRPCHVTLV